MRLLIACCRCLPFVMMLAFVSHLVVADEYHTSRVAWYSDLNKAWEHMQAKGQPMLLFVTTENCNYCTKMKRRTYADINIVSAIKRSFVPATIDGQTFNDWIGQSGVHAYPTTFIIGPDRCVIEKIDGYVNPKEMQARLTSISDKIDTVKR